MPVITVKPSSRLLVHQYFWQTRAVVTSVIHLCSCVVPGRTRRIPIVVGLVVLAASAGVQAQTLNVRVAVTSTTPARIRINAEFPNPADVISFPNSYGGVLGLAERIENVEARVASGQAVTVRELAPGEFQTSEKFNQISYDVNLNESMSPAQASHVSWLNSERGLLMLSDLLPRSIKGSGAFSSVKIQLELPGAWTAASNSEKQTSMAYFTEEPDKAVFLIGPQLQERSQRSGAKDLSVVLSGDWPIADKDALKIGRQIAQEYSKLTGFELKRNAVLILVPFPGDVGPERWAAETRGNAVVLLLGHKGSRRQTLSRLGIVLAHEIFHLWVPNSLKLEGDYDWFFEGFTIYQALRMDLRLHLISFDDYLDTIARVYDSYLSAPDRENLSLIQASERRWTTSSTLVYDKAMLVAFLYDLQLRRTSVCKASVADLYRQLFRRASTRQADANETIIGILNEQLGQESFAREYIQGVGIINLVSALSPYGISVRHTTSGTRLYTAHTDKAQKKLLNCLAGK
jgi:predicted metalloprotease with PDZ domain